jgi:hypothetical protein
MIQKPFIAISNSFFRVNQSILGRVFVSNRLQRLSDGFMDIVHNVFSFERPFLFVRYQHSTTTLGFGITYEIRKIKANHETTKL